MLSKFLTNVLVPISRLRILRLDNKQITQIHLNVHSSNRLSSRFYSNEVRLKEIQKFFKENSSDKSTETILYYSVSAVILTFGLTFAAVPLYRAFCQVILPTYLTYTLPAIIIYDFHELVNWVRRICCNRRS